MSILPAAEVFGHGHEVGQSPGGGRSGVEEVVSQHPGPGPGLRQQETQPGQRVPREQPRVRTRRRLRLPDHVATEADHP